ncbi:sensor histidine kinase [Waterburya agarophytonicola K14]|uniref:histidine kinase n=1 Tax=Waterburya agarophytonicola KI4 TaxID=2874699 RepID=A0A964FHB2_9CYAN|nr:HAMP domain-containing sensor histidine kinase [Waterburya agarophytonicola]MCC0177328.1 sensor histidine kinase [Waterburya agarophytonicola KI4]
MNEIDELKEELKQAQLAYQMAAQMSQFKAGFLARTSHELRSPLSGMIGLHQLILADLCESPEEQKEFIAQAYKSALKLLKLIDEIVAVSKTEYGSNRLNPESLQLAEIFTEIDRLTHLQAANRNLKLAIVTPDPQIVVYADRSRLIQLIFNIIDSGISLMKTGTIELSISQVTSSRVTFEIDLECPIALWQEQETIEPNFEGKDLGEIRQFLQEISLSANMKLLLSKTLLETMGGSLEILDCTHQNDGQPLTRIVLSCKKNQDNN